MVNAYTQIYIHFIFVVKFRRAQIDKDWRTDFFRVMGSLFKENKCFPKIINGVEDHVHCLITVHPTVSISELVQKVKSKSSKYINENNLTARPFNWQTGYAAFSYSKSQLSTVYNYIANQEEHHRKISFQEEYLKFLKKFDVLYEEEYLFKVLE